MFIIIEICIIMFILEAFVKCLVLLMWKTGCISILFMMEHVITIKGALRSFVKDISIRRECLNKRNP